MAKIFSYFEAYVCVCDSVDFLLPIYKHMHAPIHLILKSEIFSFYFVIIKNYRKDNKTSNTEKFKGLEFQCKTSLRKNLKICLALKNVILKYVTKHLAFLNFKK